MNETRTMIEAVVFDMDGVIVDSEPVWQQARIDFIAENGGVWTDADGDGCRGLSSAVWSARMAERLDPAMTPESVFEQVLDRMVAAYEQKLPLFPGAVETVERIASRYTVAVASGSPNALIDTILRESGLDRVCKAVGYGDEMPRGKPAPDIYLDVLRQLGVPSSQAVGIEDSESGLTAVQSAGMYCIAVVSPGYQLSPEVLDQSVWQVRSLAELTIPLIQSLDG